MSTVNASVTIDLGTERLQVGFAVPREPMPLDGLLPLARALVERSLAMAVESLPEGKSIQCRAGCGACCRQVVPISETEARMLAELVDAMPEPRRSIVRERFRQAKETLVQSGMWDLLLDRANWGPSDVHSRGVDYFHQAVACPFLEDESCSIHADRPLSCREYLVTSDPFHCERLDGPKIEYVQLPFKASTALNKMSASPNPVFHSWVPLVQIFDWLAANPNPPAPRPGPELVERFFNNLPRQQ